MMKRLALCCLYILISFSIAHAATDPDHEIKTEIARLNSAVPSSVAFGDVRSVVWLSSHSYRLLADGSREKTRTLIEAINDPTAFGEFYQEIALPTTSGAELIVEESSIRDPQTGEMVAMIPHRRFSEGDLHVEKFSLPPSSKGRLAVITYKEIEPMQYYLDDVLVLSSPSPMWEQSVRVEIPDGMEVYWEGRGVLAPRREKLATGVESLTWTLLNHEPSREVAFVSDTDPLLIFSLQRGSTSVLRSLQNTEVLFKTPQIKDRSLSGKNDLDRFGSAVHSIIKSKTINDYHLFKGAYRQDLNIREDAAMTEIEQAFTAAELFRSAGYKVRIFWSQIFQIGINGPSSTKNWEHPVLVIERTGSEQSPIYYTPIQNVEFGKIEPSLYGKVIFRFADGEIERLQIPKGSAAEHQLVQHWRLSMAEDGNADGRLDLTISGAWIDLLGLRDAASPEEAADAIEKNMIIRLPALTIEPESFKKSASNCKVTVKINVRLGIASGKDILMRIPGAIPEAIDSLPPEGTRFSIAFPFIIEQNAIVTTPPGYRAIMLPMKQASNAKDMTIDSNVVHWPKKRWAEISFKWAVRESNFDGSANTIYDQLRIASSWSNNQIPLRK